MGTPMHAYTKAELLAIELVCTSFLPRPGNTTMLQHESESVSSSGRVGRSAPNVGKQSSDHHVDKVIALEEHNRS